MASFEMPQQELPDTFEINSILILEGDDWAVVHSQPVTKPEFIKSGQLTLRLCKTESMSTDEICFSQVDITERFHDHLRLGLDEWIKTMPLNARINNPQASGLPPRDADPEEVYRIATKLSVVRESIPVEVDGVYCPICHIANIEIRKLGSPCPKCGLDLLKFGWN